MVKTLKDVLVQVKTYEEKGIYFTLNSTEDKFLSYSNLYNNAKIALNLLKKAGVKQGDEVIINIDHNEDFLIFFWGCILGGIIAVPITTGKNNEIYLKISKIWSKLDNPYIVSTINYIDGIVEYIGENQSKELSKEVKKRFINCEELDESMDTSDLDDTIDIDENDIAFIQFSSGSTGDPKGVILKHKNLISNIEAIANGIGNVDENSDSTLSWLPLTHDMGLIGFHLTPLLLEINQILMKPQLFLRNPMLWIQKIDQYRSSFINLPNFGVEYLLEKFNDNKAEGLDLSCVKLIFNGSQQISADNCYKFIEKLEKYKLKNNAIFPVYGMAEACLAVTFPTANSDFEVITVNRNNLNMGDKVIEISDDLSQKDAVKFVKLGYGVRDCEYRICNGEEVLDDMTVGEIQIFGKNVTSGYYNDSQKTEGSYSKDNWLKTGDLGFRVGNGLVVIGRLKEIIILAGVNYYPEDIERVALECVKEDSNLAAAVGISNDDRTKESLVIFLKYKGKIEDFLKINMKVKRLLKAYLEIDVKVLPIKLIPKTTSGKIQRVKLRDSYLKGEFLEVEKQLENLYVEYNNSKKVDNANTETEKNVLEVFKKVFNQDNISINDNLLDFGANSILVSSAQNEIDKIYPDKLKVEDIFAHPTIYLIAKYLDEKLSESSKTEKNVIYDLDLLLDELE